jgi:hypothetical protein
LPMFPSLRRFPCKVSIASRGMWALSARCRTIAQDSTIKIVVFTTGTTRSWTWLHFYFKKKGVQITGTKSVRDEALSGTKN